MVEQELISSYKPRYNRLMRSKRGDLFICAYGTDHQDIGETKHKIVCEILGIGDECALADYLKSATNKSSLSSGDKSHV